LRAAACLQLGAGVGVDLEADRNLANARLFPLLHDGVS
jgi:hypothetical protein